MKAGPCGLGPRIPIPDVHRRVPGPGGSEIAILTDMNLHTRGNAGRDDPKSVDDECLLGAASGA